MSREIEKLENNDTKSDSISSNSNLLSRLNKESSKTQVKNKDSNTINPSPTPMSGNNLLLYSKGCGTLRSREILKA